MSAIVERLKNTWNAFLGRDPTGNEYRYYYSNLGSGNYYRPDRFRLTRGLERSVVTSVYNRIAMDVASIKIEHCKTNQNGVYEKTIDSRFNNCLTLESNIDQISTAFMQDVCLSMFDEGVVAVVPTDTTSNPIISDSYDIISMRTGKIVEWYPYYVKINLYNEEVGQKQDIILPKKNVAIIENPLYAVMNEPNSTLQRLIRTLNSIDRTNEQNSSGKLDLIVQLPFPVRTERKREQAETRRKEIETQLMGSKYGIAYTDTTEHITQLNRAVENNLWQQATDLTNQLFNQLGLTQSIFDGTADEKTMINYYNRTVDPILDAIAKEYKRKFLSKTARTQGQDIFYFRDPFKLVPASELADIADKLTRNEILSSNEVRAEIGYQPIEDPRADELRNKNVSAAAGEIPMSTATPFGSDNGVGMAKAQKILQSLGKQKLNEEEITNGV